MPTHRASLYCLVGTAVALAAAVMPARAAETRTYVVSWFYPANYFAADACPQGLNVSAAEFYRAELAVRGYPSDQIERAMEHFPGEGADAKNGQPWVPLVTTRGNGKDNVYSFPETSPDPNLKRVEGRYSYGFDLDGKGQDEPGAFEEPTTHERGIDNQFYRAVGCTKAYVAPPPKLRPNLGETKWELLRDIMSAWLVTITSETSLAQDGPVTIVLDRAYERITRDAAGEVRADMTFRKDNNPRSHNVLKGVLKDGTILTEPSAINMIADASLVSQYQFAQARVRLTLAEDGTLKGVLGGYMPWMPIYWQPASAGHVEEYSSSLDLTGLYHALKKSADAYPDPKTGENTHISAAYVIEAVPAFIAPGAVAQAAHN